MPARRWARLALLAVPVAAAASVAVWMLSDGGSSPSEEPPLQVTADEPSYATIDELVAASDLIVTGTVVAVDDGRAITDPSDPEAGIRTRLASIGIDSVLVGEHGNTVIVEQEAALLDGTPIEVNGVSALAEGQSGLYFLVAGEGDEFPYHALVNRQGRFDVDGDALVAAAPGDPLAERIEAMTPSALRCDVGGDC
jgi:hypothetical protein